MAVTTRQANFLLPEDVLAELRERVAKREQSKFVASALRAELKRLKLKAALDSCHGAWSGRDHPELGNGTEAFVRMLRKSRRSGHSQ